MSAPAQPYGSFGSPPGSWDYSPFRNGVGVMGFALGMLAAFGTVAYAAWLVVGAVNTIGNATQHVSGTVAGSVPHAERLTAPPPVAAVPLRPTPSAATVPFDRLWVAGDGNTIVAEPPTVGYSALTGESMIQVPVTLTNNSERDWNLESTSFVGTLNHGPVAESTEGDWMYRAPIAPHTSVTLTKIFVGHPGEFTLKISAPDGNAAFAGRI